MCTAKTEFDGEITDFEKSNESCLYLQNQPSHDFLSVVMNMNQSSLICESIII